MLRLYKIFCLLLFPVISQAQHPTTFFTRVEAVNVKNNLARHSLLSKSYDELKKEVDAFVGKDVDVPMPKDPAGGYTHDRHKLNYMLMFNSGILYNLTGDKKYSTLVKNMLYKYAALNPTLKNHPEATSSSPGRIFWQALNDANWMVYTGMAYDLIYNSLTPADRKLIEDGAFKPEVDYFTHELKDWFNLLHNHAVWACAGVGIIGVATDNKDYVDMALYGTEKDGKRGFIAQMDHLFSPDGYYTEGPYYVRYAILPYTLFANALSNARPGLKIFQHRNSILQKALMTMLQQTNTNGAFFPLNDALKEKDYTSNELVTAIGIFWTAYGADPNLLAVAKKQDRVLMNNGGVAIAAAIAANKNVPVQVNYRTIESVDGVKGDEGGVSIIRNGKNKDLTSLIFKYTSHGLSHGHYDKLNINLYDQGNEILTDYGSVRFIGVEQKYGGRYLPENKSFAAQTIAHNTIVVDEKSHFGGKESTAEQHHSNKLFSSITNPALQVVAAAENNAYSDVRLKRTVYMIQLPGGRKLVADIFNANSGQVHQYDLPFQFNGQLIQTSFKYKSFGDKQQPLGKKNGYQYYWREAEADLKDTTAQITILNGNTFYTISSLITDSAQVVLARTGANDPDFNLRREPAFIIRKKGKDQAFVSVLEIHGKWDPVIEISANAYPVVKSIRVLQDDANYTVATILVGEKPLIIAQANKEFNSTTKHTAAGMSWTGPFTVLWEGKKL